MIGTIMGGFLGWLFGLGLGSGLLGMLFGGWLGRRFDLALGRLLSQGFYAFAHGQSSASQQVFFDVAFEVMGHLAKADGVVTPSGIKAAERVMAACRMSTAAKQAARQAFRRGKHPQFDLNAALGRFIQTCGHDPIRIRLFLDFLQQAASADGPMSAKKQALFERICQTLGIGMGQGFGGGFAGGGFHGQQQRAGARPTGGQLSEAYATLGISAKASGSEIKRAYHKKMAEYHPDRLMAKGVPEEMMNVAKEKARAINNAYALIKKERGLK